MYVIEYKLYNILCEGYIQKFKVYITVFFVFFSEKNLRQIGQIPGMNGKVTQNRKLVLMS